MKKEIAHRQAKSFGFQTASVALIAIVVAFFVCFAFQVSFVNNANTLAFHVAISSMMIGLGYTFFTLPKRNASFLRSLLLLNN